MTESPEKRVSQHLLVTGGCGFIGSAFIRFLFRRPDFDGKLVNLDVMTYAANPDNVAGAVDERRYTFVHGDICDEELVERVCREHEIDTIVNFAAESHVDRSILGPQVFVQTNVVGTLHLLEVVRRLPSIHFHHVSTDEVYGSLGETGLFREDSPYAPNSPYAASKAASDHLVRAYAHTYGLSTTVSNCSNNYGPCQFPEKLIPLMILNLQEKKPLPVYGDGGNVRDWLYVDDHAEALWIILRQGARGATYNIGGEAEWNNLALIKQLIGSFAEVQRHDPAPLFDLITFVTDRPGHDRRYAIDCSRLKRELGWRQQHDLASGLRHTIQWYLDNPQWIARVKNGSYREWIEKNYGDRA
jgi:dTDP-glucose 4,6-dehydratase